MPLDKIGKYEIVRELGKGAMGIVYEARDPHLGRKVAVKTIRFDVIEDPALVEDMRRRFVREAQSAGNLHHANIVTIHEIGEDQGALFFVMEFVEGQSLEKLIASKTKLTPDEVVALVRSIAEALDYAHRKGIIHRDIKPANILIDTDGCPRIVDFGIAHIPSSTMTQTGTALGTPSYMAPEQIVGQKLDARADLFALGVIIYELLTLQKPFPGDNVTTIIYKIMNENPRPPRELDHGVPEGLEAIVRKAIAKRPDDRYQTARELIADLNAYAGLHGAGVVPGMAPVEKTVAYRGGPAKAMKRKSPAVLVSVIAIVLLAAGAGAVLLLTKKGEPIPADKPAGMVVQPQAEVQGKDQTAVKPAETKPKPAVTKPAEAAKPKPPDAKKPEETKPAEPVQEELKPVRAIGDVKPPKLIKEVAPVYPEAARKAGTKGYVILEVTTDSRGHVTNAKVLRSLPGCDQAAVDAVTKYLYEPVIVKGKPRGVIFSTTVFFR